MLAEKDSIGEVYECLDKDVQNMISVMSNNTLLCYIIDTSKFEHVDEMKQILVGFAKKLILLI